MKIKDMNCYNCVHLDYYEKECFEDNSPAGYYKINADKIKAKTREWYIVNKEKAHESGRLWAISNKEKVQLYRSKWKEANTEAISSS